MITETNPRRVHTIAPERAIPTRRVFTDREGILWKVYVLPVSGAAHTSEMIAYVLDPSVLD